MPLENLDSFKADGDAKVRSMIAFLGPKGCVDTVKALIGAYLGLGSLAGNNAAIFRKTRTTKFGERKLALLHVPGNGMIQSYMRTKGIAALVFRYVLSVLVLAGWSWHENLV